MKCPVCTTVNLVMSERQGIEIDYCPECRGVWLDRGELDKIIERTQAKETAATQSPQPAAQPAYAPQQTGQAPAGYGYSHKPYRKKSFLEELFD
ncbi:zf-TFIIB domain-containing protein [Geobacter sulfurreducens]|uniref:TFIIB-type zinc ribbon-containing protein n=1 Tax=Geobacter sulfurreducens TaxID=35554 RepID=UPI002CAB235F|nr:zf-TFIIB domain-containing protein [Geobacter sulfurreducens]HML78411.1 zf-TFIIB domain-containing protein [Geobacter sulfurreducens]